MSNSFLVTLIVIICLILCSCNITREVTSLHSDGSEGLYESSEESVQPEQVVEFLSLADTVVANSVGIDGTEYEYTFTNGTMDFAMVYNNRKRKSLGALNVAKVDAFGKVASGSFHRHTSSGEVKHLRWFLNRDAELYYFAFSKEGKKSVIVFEPSEEMVRYIKHYLPYGAHQEN